MFSDWGAASWSEDLEAAKAQADTWLVSTGTIKKWSAAELAFVRAAIVAAGDAADGWMSDDIPGFWTDLSARVRAYTGKKPESWDKVADAYALAGGASTTTAAGREAGSVATVAGGTVAGTAGDLAEMGAAAGEAIGLLKRPYVWVGLAALAAFAAYKLRK